MSSVSSLLETSSSLDFETSLVSGNFSAVLSDARALTQVQATNRDQRTVYAPSNPFLGPQKIPLKDEHIDIISSFLPARLPDSLYSYDTFITDNGSSFTNLGFAFSNPAQLRDGSFINPGAYVRFPLTSNLYDFSSTFTLTPVSEILELAGIEETTHKITHGIYDKIAPGENNVTEFQLSSAEDELIGNLPLFSINQEYAFAKTLAEAFLERENPNENITRDIVYSALLQVMNVLDLIENSPSQDDFINTGNFILNDIRRDDSIDTTYVNTVFNLLKFYGIDGNQIGTNNISLLSTFTALFSFFVKQEYETRAANIFEANPIDLEEIDANDPLNNPIEDPKTVRTAIPVDLEPDLGVLQVSFDEDTYLSFHVDVKQAVEQGVLKSGFEHYVKFGLNEGRFAPVFDEDVYRTENPDVAVLVNAGILTSAFDHYIRFGIAEGRNGIINEAEYLAANPDVAAAVAAGRFSSGTDHFYEFGYKGENRERAQIVDDAVIGQLNFVRNINSGEFTDEFELLYRLVHSDVNNAVNSGFFETGLDHYLTFGFKEDRLLLNFDELDEAQYLVENPDVASAVENGIFLSGLAHFVSLGINEGRGTNLLIDENEYLANNPDVAAAVNTGVFSSGIEHYLRFGLREGREAVFI